MKDLQNLDIIKEAIEVNSFVPEYTTFDADKLEGTFTRLPERSELPAEINEQLSLSSTLVNFRAIYFKNLRDFMFLRFFAF